MSKKVFNVLLIVNRFVFVSIITLFVLQITFHPVNCCAQNTKSKVIISSNNNPFYSLSEKQFISIPGKPISDTLVKYLLFSKYADWQIAYDSVTSHHKIKDSIFTKKFIHLNYFNVNDGIEFSIEEDTVRNIVIYAIETDDYPNHWKRYKGKLPYNLNINMTRQEIINISGVPNVHTFENIIWYYPDKKLNIEFTSEDYNSAKIKLFVFYK